MTPERIARLVGRWVRLYTRGLPGPVAERRVEELDADVHDHIEAERARGTADRRIALSVLSRMVRGLGADASWRRRVTRTPSARRSVARVALVIALILLVPLVGMAFTDEVRWSVADFVFAGALLGVTGLLLELSARNPRRIAYRLAATAIGAAAMLLGSADDAPGLVLFGCLLIGGTVAMAVRTAQRGE